MTDPVVPPAAVADVRSSMSDGEWHRLHPLTPLLRGGLFLIVILGIVVANLRDRLIALFLPWLMPPEDARQIERWENSGDPVDWVIANNLYFLAVLAVVVVLIVLIVVFWLSWRFHTFRITGDAVEVRSGVLFRTQRRAPLDRVQGVNLTRPMVARILGMAKLEVVGAGNDANVKLEYLSTTNAEEVRADILRLASGRRLAEGAAARAAGGLRRDAIAQTVSRGVNGLIAGDDASSPAPESVVHIPTVRLIVSQILGSATIGLVIALAVVIWGISTDRVWVLFAFIPAIIGFGAYWGRTVLKSLRYSIAPTPDGVRITFGLLTTVTEILPPGRIHAVEVLQPLLWRPMGWRTIRINRLTGRAMEGGDQFTTVLPVGTDADVERVLRLLLPHLPAAEWPLILDHAIHGGPADPEFIHTPARARILRLLSWRRNAFRLTADLLLLRRGALRRAAVLLPLARLQSIRVAQGPIDRALAVAGIHGHTIAGPVSGRLGALDRDAALRLFADVEVASVAAATSDHSHRWAQTLDDPEASAATSAAEASGPSDAPDVPAENTDRGGAS